MCIIAKLATVEIKTQNEKSEYDAEYDSLTNFSYARSSTV